MSERVSIRKIAASAIFLSLTLAFNLCAFEGFADSRLIGEKAPAHPCGHHEAGPAESSGHHNPESNDRPNDKEGAEFCCDNLLAILQSQNISQDLKFAPKSFIYDEAVMVPLSKPRHQFDFKEDFSPGKSPPTVFLLSSFTHAPPIL